MNDFSDRRVLDAILRRDFASFVKKVFQIVSPGDQLSWNWHLDAICHVLMRVYRREIKRLLIEVPPRSLKSIISSVAYPAFVLGHDPTHKLIGVSYSQDLQNKMSADCRRVMMHPIYQRLFPASQLDPKKAREDNFQTVAGGVRYASSVGSTLTGRGGNTIIIDDPLKADDAYSEAARSKVIQWFQGTLSSRLNNKKDDSIVVVQQRLHEDDLAGHLRCEGGWHILSLPAIAAEDMRIALPDDKFHSWKAAEVLHPTREGRLELDELKRSMGFQAFSAQYLQAPVPPESDILVLEWFKTIDAPFPEWDRRIVQSWDVAAKDGENNDWTVGTTWHVRGKEYHLVDVERKKVRFPDLVRLVGSSALRHKIDTLLIEDTGNGTALIDELKRHDWSVPSPIAIKPERDKLVRFQAQTSKIEAGQVSLPKDAPWKAEFLKELLQFPHGKHDDQVDSVSQFLGWIDRRSRDTVVRVPMFQHGKNGKSRLRRRPV
ncbi:MAG: phage terminase large subunit [Pseudomonadota bacterium]